MVGKRLKLLYHKILGSLPVLDQSDDALDLSDYALIVKKLH